MRSLLVRWMVIAFMQVLGGNLNAQQQYGGIRGTVYDGDFDIPIASASVVLVSSGGGEQRTTTTDQGSYAFQEVVPGTYAVVFTKDGYVRRVESDVVVAAGRLTELNAYLSSEFVEMDEFVVQDILQLVAGSETALLQLRLESPSLMDSIGADLMSRAGASDAAGALKLVVGATVKDDKSAVIRGLPDRYVSSQLNGARVPTADEDKRAVELDQFPAPVIESIQVSKTFTPDQQGDASGGAVDVRTKGIPDEAFLQFKSQVGYNSNVAGGEFLSYEGGGINQWGEDDGQRRIQTGNIGDNWDGAVGVSEGDTPTDHKWSIATGGKKEIDDEIRVGGFASVFYERDSAFYDDGIDDSWWVQNPGDPMTPETNLGSPQQGTFFTSLLDVTRAEQSVQWGGLGSVGLETENHALGIAYLYSRTAEDSATLAEDTRGKEYFFPGYDPDDPLEEGNSQEGQDDARYIRFETLDYTERTTDSLQFTGEHKLPIEALGMDESGTFKAPELEWTIAESSASFNQPDKRFFGAYWVPGYFHPDFGYVPPFWVPWTPAENAALGNLQRTWKEIKEDSDLKSADLTVPFEQWNDEEGFLRTGAFEDKVNRRFDQDTFSNFSDTGSGFDGDWADSWSDEFPDEDHAITESTYDVDYDGELDISAWYAMFDLPVATSVDIIGGARFETTEINVINEPEADALWFPPGSSSGVKLEPGDADVFLDEEDWLPALGVAYEPVEAVMIRGGYSETVARQTFKELTPIIQQEYIGGPIFIGNPDLEMSSVKNYDLRVDYSPYEGGLASISVFSKDITDPIEYVQQLRSFDFTTAVNYPKGELDGLELEARQRLGNLWERLEGFSVGANATFIESEVTLPVDEAASFDMANIRAPTSSRDMTNAPEHLYNLFLTYDWESTGTQVGLFYTVQGDTLVAGAGQSADNYVPDVYATEFDTLNLSFSQRIGKYFKLQFQAKNLTNPEYQTVYRSDYIGEDVLKSSHTAGIEFTLSLGAEFGF